MTILAILISTAMLTGQGIPYNQEFQVNTLESSFGRIPKPKIIPLSNGDFIICWDIKNEIYAQYFNIQSGSVGDEFKLIEFSERVYFSIDSNKSDELFLCWWIEGGGIYYQRFKTNGQKLSEKIQINSGNSISTDRFNDGKITFLTNNRVFINWGREDSLYINKGYQLVGKIIDIQGNNISSEILINESDFEFQYYGDVVSLNDSLFITCWQSYDYENQNWNVFAQIFDNDGNKIGSKIQINSSINSHHVNGHIAKITNDTFIVVWMNYENKNGDNITVLGRRFDFNGEPLGDEFKINTLDINGDSFYSRIASNSNGNNIVFWYSDVDTYHFGEETIFAQYFNKNAEKIGPEFIVHYGGEYNNLEPNYGCRNPEMASLDDFGFVFSYSTFKPRVGLAVYAKYYLADPILHDLQEFEIHSPVNDRTLICTRPTFTWQKPSDIRVNFPYEIEYYLYLDTSNEFDNPLIYPGIQDTTFFLENDSLQSGQTYFWKVLAKNIAGDSLWSSSTNAFFVSHTATEVEVEAQLPTGFALEQNYPNPFNPETTVRYNLPKTGAVELKLYDITGREVMSLVNEWQSAGSHSIKVDGRNLASGVYVYTLTAGDYRESKKMALVR